MKRCIKLSIVLVGLFFLCIGTKVYAFDHDQTANVQGVNFVRQSNVWLTDPFPTTGITYSDMSNPNYIYGGFWAPNNGNTRLSYVRLLNGSFYSEYVASKNYTIEVVFRHSNGIYNGMFGQGKVVDNYCSLTTSYGSANNVSCSYEQNTYISGDNYYDRLRIYFTTSSNNYSSVLYTWQFGQITSNGYILVNTRSATISEDGWIAYNATYIGYDNDDPNSSGIINRLDRNNATQKEANTLLGQIREKINDFKSSMEQKFDSLIGKVQSIYNTLTSESYDITDIDDILGLGDGEDEGPVSGVINAPISWLQSFYNNNSAGCGTLSLTMFNTSIRIPYGCFFWDRQDVQSFRAIWQLLFGGFLIYKMAYRVIKQMNNALDPTKDDIGGLEV